MVILLRRTAIFILIVLAWALLAAAVAHSATRAQEIAAFFGFVPDEDAVENRVPSGGEVNGLR